MYEKLRKEHNDLIRYLDWEVWSLHNALTSEFYRFERDHALITSEYMHHFEELIKDWRALQECEETIHDAYDEPEFYDNEEENNDAEGF